MEKLFSFNFRERLRWDRSAGYWALIFGALFAFEVFNFSTTDFALQDLLGDIRFAGMRWATILAVAFCGIDFAGIARIFSRESGPANQTESLYLFGAWLLAASLNALLTWWGVTIAILDNSNLGNAVIDQATLLKIVPVFVACLVWLTRICLIGAFTIAGKPASLPGFRTPAGRSNQTGPAPAPDRGQNRFRPASWQTRKR